MIDQPAEKPRFKCSFIAGILMLLSFVVYSLPSHSLEGTDAGGDTGAAEILPIAVLRYHALDFTQLVRDYPLPQTNGTSALPYYLTEVNGRVVSFYPIVPGLLNVPVYAVADRLGVDLFRHRYQLSAVTSAGITAMSVGAMLVILSMVCRDQRTAIFFSLVYAFGTTAWSVCSRTLWQHGPAMLFLSAALGMIFCDKRRWIAFAGFFLAMAVWTRPSVALIVLPIAVFIAMKRPKSIAPFILWSLPPAMLMASYSYHYFGSVLNLGQGRNIVADSTGPESTYGTGWIGLVGLLFSPARGLLIFTPVFIFSFIQLFRNLCGFSVNLARYLPRHDRARRGLKRQALQVGRCAFYGESGRMWSELWPYLSIAVLVYIGFYSQWKIWWGGYCFGYRLLSEIVPILILFLAQAWQSCIASRKLLRFIFIVLLGISVYFQFLGAMFYPTNFNNVPNSVNYHPQRLWNVRDTELTRCQRAMFNN